MGFGKEGQLRYLVSSCHEGDASLQIPGEPVSFLLEGNDNTGMGLGWCEDQALGCGEIGIWSRWGRPSGHTNRSPETHRTVGHGLLPVLCQAGIWSLMGVSPPKCSVPWSPVLLCCV